MKLIHKAHGLFKTVLFPGDSAVDATCGGGNDRLVLAKLCLTPESGSLHLFDIQETAIVKTKKRLENSLPENVIPKIYYYNRSHVEMPPDIRPKLITFNLGFLPSGDPAVMTTPGATVVALARSFEILETGGALSVMVYPGHETGRKEAGAIDNWLSESFRGRVIVYRDSPKNHAPYLLWLLK
ncbi:MAG: hypothetical protein A3F09_02560 [Chlamydiae bacterium RIFCSPHIGHO2_12_FULL_49_11]|nr:MAG: hypothetical protein A3F09_02560 [Chlamydiae bacterium RIFCSPHIGHO2_12_FULL_49_11]